MAPWPIYVVNVMLICWRSFSLLLFINLEKYISIINRTIYSLSILLLLFRFYFFISERKDERLIFITPRKSCGFSQKVSAIRVLEQNFVIDMDYKMFALHFSKAEETITPFLISNAHYIKNWIKIEIKMIILLHWQGK